MRRSSAGAWVAVFALALAGAVACSQTDAGLTTKVKTKLAADDTVKAYQIDVDTKDKIVTLTGSVDSQAAKDQAVAIARGTEGVADVVDNITVSGMGGETMGGGAAGMDTAMTPGMAMTTPSMGVTPMMETTPGAR
jgi:BON domain